MSAPVDRIAWRARYEAGERTVVLAEEAGLSRGHMIKVLRSMGTAMRPRGGGVKRTAGLKREPNFWERLAAGYPDSQRKAWVEKQAQLWRWRRRP